MSKDAGQASGKHFEEIASAVDALFGDEVDEVEFADLVDAALAAWGRR